MSSSLEKKIKQLRKKTPQERKRITFFISVGFTGLVVFVWSTAILPRTISSVNQVEGRATSISPVQTLFEDIGIVWDDTKNVFDSLSSVTSDFFSSETDEDSFPVEGEDTNENPQSGRFIVEDEEVDEEGQGGASLEDEDTREDPRGDTTDGEEDTLSEE